MSSRNTGFDEELGDILVRLWHDAKGERAKALTDLERFYKRGIENYRGGNPRRLDSMRSKIFPMALIRHHLRTWKHAANPEVRATLVRAMYLPSLCMLPHHFDDFKDFVLEAIQDTSPLVRLAARQPAGWLRRGDIGDDKKVPAAFNAFLDELAVIVHKEYGPSLALPENPSDLKASVFKSAVQLMEHLAYGEKENVVCSIYRELYAQSNGLILSPGK